MIDLASAYEVRDMLSNEVIDKIEDEFGNIWYEAFKPLIASGVPPITLQKCKGVNLVDYKIYGDSVQNGTPTPETPIEVESVGEKTKNLDSAIHFFSNFPYFTEVIEDGRNCVKYADNKTKQSSFVFKENTQYTFSFEAKRQYKPNTIQDKNDTFELFRIVYTDGTTTRHFLARNTPNDTWDKFTITSNTNKSIDYVCSGVYQDYYYGYIDIDTFQIEEGSTATEYEPYGYKIPVVSRGVNLFDMAELNATVTTVNGITFTPLNDERVHIKGKLEDTTKGATVIFKPKTNGTMPVKRGTYRAKPNKYTSNGLTLMFGINNGSTGKNINSMHSSTAIDFDGAYIGSVYLGIFVGTTIEFDDIIELQLVEGTANLPYEPYIEPVTTNIYLDEPLRKLGDYADYIDFENDKVVRNIKKIVLTGGVEYRYTSYASKGYYIYGTHTLYSDANIYNFTHYVKHVELSTHFEPATSNDSSGIKTGDWFINTGYRLRFTLAPETFASDGAVSTLDDINAWLQSQNEAGTPVTFYYITTEPTPEDITLPNIQTHKGTTIIEFDTLNPSNMEVIYYGKGKLEKLEETENIVLNDILNDNTETEIDITDTEINQKLDEIIGG